jgi:hypothetical protein
MSCVSNDASASSSKRARRDLGGTRGSFELKRVMRKLKSTATLPDVILLPHGAFVVGSQAKGVNAVCLEHASLSRLVSRTHAEFAPKGDGHYVMDLGSTNGTFVNGKQLEPHARRSLQHGDCLTFGERMVTVPTTEETTNCYAYVYQRRAPAVLSSMLPLRGKHDFGRPITSFVGRKLRDTGIYKMHLSV